MALEGSLRDRHLGEVMMTLARETRTGILTLQGSDEIIGVAFLKGSIVSADALNQTLEDGLGRVLSEHNLVSTEDFSSLAAEHHAGGGRVLDLLVERGYVERSQLLGAVRLETARLCRDVLAWSEGQFKFYRGDEVSYEEGIEPIEVEELLQEAASEDLGRATPIVESHTDPVGEDVSTPVAERVTEAPSSLLVDPTEVDEAVEVTPPAQAVEMPTPVPTPVPSFDTPRPTDVSRVAYRRPERSSSRTEDRWAMALMAAVLLGWVGLGALSGAGRVLFPVRGQEELRRGSATVAEVAAAHRMDRGLRTYFLLEGRFPDTLEELVERGLVSRRDLDGPAGRPLRYARSPAGVRRGFEEPLEGGWDVSGDFLLDPEIIAIDDQETPPLVLLD